MQMFSDFGAIYIYSATQKKKLSIKFGHPIVQIYFVNRQTFIYIVSILAGSS